jgi:hypothetical protein
MKYTISTYEYSNLVLELAHELELTRIDHIQLSHKSDTSVLRNDLFTLRKLPDSRVLVVLAVDVALVLNQNLNCLDGSRCEGHMCGGVASSVDNIDISLVLEQRLDGLVVVRSSSVVKWRVFVLGVVLHIHLGSSFEQQINTIRALFASCGNDRPLIRCIMYMILTIAI